MHNKSKEVNKFNKRKLLMILLFAIYVISLACFNGVSMINKAILRDVNNLESLTLIKTSNNSTTIGKKYENLIFIIIDALR